MHACRYIYACACSVKCYWSRNEPPCMKGSWLRVATQKFVECWTQWTNKLKIYSPWEKKDRRYTLHYSPHWSSFLCLHCLIRKQNSYTSFVCIISFWQWLINMFINLSILCCSWCGTRAAKQLWLSYFWRYKYCSFRRLLACLQKMCWVQ